ncbi:MAG: TIGR02281 family clan AA aspartic protease [Hyphomicrobiales bacterium]|nr:TIGR02281 family clan AA aspartic protease [Hyphomicrobiales bacterium]
MRSIVTFAGLALAASILVPRYAAHIGDPHAPLAMAARPQPPAVNNAANPANSRSVVVPRDGRGHFEVEARIDGRPLNFMVDTGATVIALTAADAARLGIRPAPREFLAEVRTANGTVRAAPTRLNRVEIGDLVVRDVAALVMPDGALSDNLLGLSFLSRLRHFEYTDGKLVLEQ